MESERRHSGQQGEEGHGGTEDSAGTKESEEEKGADTRRQKTGSKEKKGVRERERAHYLYKCMYMYNVCVWSFQFFSPRIGGGLLNIFSASHQNKNAELHKIFTSLPTSEKLIDGEITHTRVYGVRIMHVYMCTHP